MSASSVTSKSTAAAAIADDTTNTPYNPDKQQRPRSPSASDTTWKRSKTGKSLLTPLSTEASMALSDPPPPLVDGLPAPYPPVPPPAPRYCTRQTVKQMQVTADAVTKQELAKLQQSTQPATTPLQTGNTTDLHHIMYKYADKQQALCTQLCDLNTRLQARQDEIVRLKDAKYEADGDIEHYKGIADSYEEDIQVLTEERDAAREERDEGLFALAEAEAATRAVRASIPSWCLLVCAMVVFLGFHLNYKYDLDLQARYADAVQTIKFHYWVWVTTCFVEEGNAAEQAHARAVPGV